MSAAIGPGTPPGAFVGDRVVVRYRLGASAPADWRDAPNPAPGPGRPSLSDVTGRLVDDGDPVRLDRDGTIESIPAAAITSIRLLSSVPVRNSDIRALERAAAVAWPGLDHEFCDGWLLRSGAGISRRANSAIAVDRDARADADILAAIDAWYAARQLPVLVAVPERLLTRQIAGEPVGPEVHVLTTDLDGDHHTGDNHPGDDHAGHVPDSVPVVSTSATPSREWVRAYLGDDTQLGAAGLDAGAALLTGLADPTGMVAFATIEENGRPVAIGRGAVTSDGHGGRWVGLTALWTAPGHRRRHLGDAVMSRLLRWGAEQGAARAYVQSESDDRVAGSWYRARGFALHHRYHYLMRRRGR